MNKTELKVITHVCGRLRVLDDIIDENLLVGCYPRRQGMRLIREIRQMLRELHQGVTASQEDPHAP